MRRPEACLRAIGRSGAALLPELPESSLEGAPLQFLHQSGCDYVQGFGISRALPAEDFQVVASQWL